MKATACSAETCADAASAQTPAIAPLTNAKERTLRTVCAPLAILHAREGVRRHLRSRANVRPMHCFSGFPCRLRIDVSYGPETSTHVRYYCRAGHGLECGNALAYHSACAFPAATGPTA